MKVDLFSLLPYDTWIQKPVPPQSPIKELTQDFSLLLKKTLDKVNKQENNADKMIQRFAAGEEEDIHKVLLALSKSELYLQFLITLRDRALAAYAELLTFGRA